MALTALGMWTFACAVYQADQIPLDGGDQPVAGSGGAASGGGGQINQAGTSPASAGKAGSAPLGGSGGVQPAPEEHGGDSSGGAADAGGESPGGAATGGGGGSAGSGMGGIAGAGGGAGGGGNGGMAGDGGNAGSSGTGGAGGNGGNGGNGGTSGNAGTAGNGGVGGGTPVPTCGDHPLTASSTWIASASHDNAGTSPASNVLDGKTTRWTTGKPQSGDEWLQVDFGRSVSLSHVNLQQGNVDTNDYPRSYAVIVSDTTKNLSATPRATGMGKTGVSTPIALPQLATGRYLLIKQLGSSLSWWSTQEVEVSCSN